MTISSMLFLAKIRRTGLRLPATQLLVSRFDWRLESPVCLLASCHTGARRHTWVDGSHVSMTSLSHLAGASCRASRCCAELTSRESSASPRPWVDTPLIASTRSPAVMPPSEALLFGQTCTESSIQLSFYVPLDTLK